MKGLISLILFSHLFIAFCASSLYVFYKEVLNESIDLFQLAFIFLGTAFAYNLIELFPSNKLGLKTIRGSWISANKNFVIFLNSLFFILLGFLFFKLDLETIWVYLSLFIMVLIYEGSFHRKLAIRKIPYLKSFYIALVWALAIFAPDPFGKYASLQSLLTFVEVYFFIFALCLSFDIRDFSVDQKSDLKTIVTKFGEKKSRIFCLVIFIFQSAVAFLIRTDIYTLLGEIISLFIFSYLLKKVTSSKGDLWCYAGIDGLILLKWLAPLLRLA